MIFADVDGAAGFGESIDPEAMHAVLTAYYERTKAAAERHGGVVEKPKFTGEAAMAVFGLSVTHEDDSVRALRAAVEMRSAGVELGIECRIGIETGEVAVQTPELLVTGRAVTTAAHLRRVAKPGEILLGSGTMELSRAAATVEPLSGKKKADSVQAWRLVSVLETAPARRFDSTFVGRGRELETLRETWNRMRPRSVSVST